MQRLIANLLMYWMVFLLPGAAALDLAQPELLLPACCRAHGAHHCALGAVVVHSRGGPSWSGPGCPFAHVSRAAILLTLLAPRQADLLPGTSVLAHLSSAKDLLTDSWLAGLPPSRGPPTIA